MKRNLNHFLFLMLLGLMLVSSAGFAQTTIRGSVTDESGEPLTGANVIVKGTADGDVTDLDGNYTVSSSEVFPFTLVFSYTGFNSQEIEVNSTSPVNVTLVEGILSDEVVVSASRRVEKVQDAPASISVLSARKLESTANSTDATRNLINVAGVQIQQQSANRINISMRGSAGLFGTGVFPIMDYRSLVAPGIGVFQSDQAGISNIDLQRVEVVRGAGSALYGPGVTQGVVHFITKNPIDFPGTTIEVMGGELETFGIGARHATKVSDKFGFKINAQYRRGGEFTLDPNDPADSAQISLFKTSIVNPALTPNGFVDINGTPTEILSLADENKDGNPMADEWENAAINATLEFRPKDNLSIFTSGGFTNATSVFYNEQGEGLAQSNEYWGQARMQYGGLFAQFFAVANDGGGVDNPTFLYQTGNNTSIARTQLEGQLQYNWDVMNFLNSNWTAGFDYRYAGQDTKNLVYGRNEDDDSYSVAGVYFQGKMALHNKVDLVVAARGDKFNFIDDIAFAPRLALVYKAAPAHTFRASFNRTASTVSNLQLNVDFPLNSAAWLYGNKNEQTFDKNLPHGWLFGDGFIPEGSPVLPLGVAYGAVAEPTLAGIAQALDGNPLLPIVTGVLQNSIDPATLGVYSQPLNLAGGYNIFDNTPLGKINAPLTALSTNDAYEIGYKGLIKNKLGISLDLYMITEKNNSQFTAISPSYRIEDVSGIGTELGSAIGAQIQAPMIAALMTQAGMDQATAEATYAVLGPQIIGAFTLGGNGFAAAIDDADAHAASPTDQIPANGSNYLAAGYRTFDERSYVGYDIGLEYYFNNALSAFFNYSGVNKNEFKQLVVGNEEAGELPTYLNIPKNKFRLGGTYAPDMGLRGSISFQHDEPYVASAGQFSTDDITTDEVEKTEVRNLVDASVGYKLANGLAIDVSATNLLNNEYRYLPNMPKIGRRVLGKLTYTFGGNKNKGIGSVKIDSDGDGIADHKDKCPNLAGKRKWKGCPMSASDMAAKAAAEEQARLAAEAARIAAAAKAEADAKAAAEAEAARIAAAEAAEAARVAAAAAAAAAKATDAEAAKNTANTTTATGTQNTGSFTHEHDGVEHSHENTGPHIHVNENAVTGTATADSFKSGTGSYTHSHPGIGEHSHDNNGEHTHPDVTSDPSGLNLSGIQFVTAQATFTSASYAIMDRCVAYMNQNSTVRMTIEGHTDSVGSRGPNKVLSQSRANAVKRYLVSKGISASRLTAIGYGEERPIADNTYKEGRAKNRRVVFVPSY